MLEVLDQYLEVLLEWNARTNLTAIRDPEEIVRRHFGESLFLATHVSGGLSTGAEVLDFGSGAGFPGLPLQLYRPDLRVFLAESQNKKSAFLREVARTLGVKATVWPRRVEQLPTDQQFALVTLRAVDRMDDAATEAKQRLAPGGRIALLGTVDEEAPFWGSSQSDDYPIPGLNRGVLRIWPSHQ